MFVLFSLACTVPHDGLQPGPVGPCATAADCNDGVDCTNDTCASGTCVSTPDDSLCMGQVCSPALGRCAESDECVPEQCAMDRQLPGSCQVGVCSSDECVLGPVNSACSAGESCCGNGACAPCDDGSPCTTDACDLSAPGCDPDNPTAECCSHVPFDGDCDDGSYCNGPETCVAGTCVDGAEPCEAGATCMEAIDRCDSCVSDAGCPAAPGPWSPCEQNAGAFCNNQGTRTRTVETSQCVEGRCVAGPSHVETDSMCSFDPTTLGACMPTTNPAFGTCTFPTTPCAGTQSRIVTTYSCLTDGTCQGVGSMETRGCNQMATITCGTTTTTPFGACGGFADTCSVNGTQSRMVTTFACNGTGSCTPTTVPDSQSCTRGSQDGMMCMAVTGRACMPDGANSCTGTRVNRRVCGGGTCSVEATMPCNMPPATGCGPALITTSCVPDGTSCAMGDGSISTILRACDGSGACVNGAPTVTPSGLRCALSSAEADGAMCDDEDQCTVMDECNGNTCEGAPKCAGMCLDMGGSTTCGTEETCQCNSGSGMCSCG